MISNNSSWKKIFPTSAAMKSQGLYVYNELQFMIRQELSDVPMNHKKDMPQGFFSDDAEKLTSEVHDPYTRITVAWKIEQHRNTFKRGLGVEPVKFPPKVKSKNVFTTLEC